MLLSFFIFPRLKAGGKCGGKTQGVRALETRWSPELHVCWTPATVPRWAHRVKITAEQVKYLWRQAVVVCSASNPSPRPQAKEPHYPVPGTCSWHPSYGCMPLLLFTLVTWPKRMVTGGTRSILHNISEKNGNPGEYCGIVADTQCPAYTRWHIIRWVYINKLVAFFKLLFLIRDEKNINIV